MIIMKNDFLEEIWRVREKLAARFDYDLHRMVVHLQKAQAKHGDRLVRLPIRRKSATIKARKPARKRVAAHA
jgi:hypothetical protein